MEVLAPQQVAIGASGGISILVFGMRLLLDRHTWMEGDASCVPQAVKVFLPSYLASGKTLELMWAL